MAQSQAPGMSRSVMRQVGSTAPAASGQGLVVDGQVIRDARLDAYFDAHRGVRALAPSPLAGGGPRSAEILVPQR
jgi:sigma-E factor negative regulatory protein RseA